MRIKAETAEAIERVCYMAGTVMGTALLVLALFAGAFIAWMA